MPFKKGERTTGRQPGTPNKITRTVRETVLAAFQELQEDPKTKITEWAKREPTEFYKIASKLIPTEVTGKIKNIIVVKSDEEDDEQSTSL